jgi:hypothetical protein
MLLLSAALLTASIHTQGVVEVPVVPAVTTVSATPAERIEDRSRPTRKPVMTGGHEAADAHAQAAAVGKLSGRAFLTGLGRLSADGLRSAAADAAVLDTALDTPPSADTVEDWWTVLPATTRTRLVANAPQVVGNLEGVPYRIRDEANRSFLRSALRAAAVHGSRTASKAVMLGKIEKSLQQTPGGPEKQLLTIDTRGAGRASISVGDLQTASDVSIMVPGMFFTVTGQMTDWTRMAGDLYAEQATVSSQADHTGGIAVVAWMGYRTPDMSNILSLDLARVGASRLERVVDGLDTERAVDRPRVSIVAHSYGSTTALIALSSGRMSADSLTLLGTPGTLGVDHASQLAVTAGEVFVGESHWDPVAGSGFFGPDPGNSAFGATVMNLTGGIDAQDDNEVFAAPFSHNGYFVQGTESLHDIALIAVGRSDLVKEAARPSNRSNGSGGGSSPDFLLVRPQDLLQRD